MLDTPSHTGGLRLLHAQTTARFQLTVYSMLLSGEPNCPSDDAIGPEAFQRLPVAIACGDKDEPRSGAQRPATLQAQEIREQTLLAPSMGLSWYLRQE